MRLSLPATASRLMSAICGSFAAGALLLPFPLHPLRGMESGVAPVCFGRSPVGRHPAGPAQLPELAETDGFAGARRNGELGVPIELRAIEGIDEIGERLAQIAAGQKAHVLREGPRVDAKP